MVRTENGRPFFSVVIPSHDRQNMLDEAVTSVLSQTDPDWELIVVDDASPTPARVPVDSRIRLLRNEESQGPTGARNRGIQAAVGRFIAFLDDDDSWTTRRLERARAAHSAADVVVCAPSTLGDGTSDASWHRGSGPVSEWILDGTNPNLGATSVRHELCPLFDPRYPASEDLDWWLRLAQMTQRVTYLPTTDWLWRRHTGARHGVGTEYRREGQLLLLRDHAGYFRSHPRARAFRWRRIGLLSLDLGERRAAIEAGLRSLTSHPTTGALKLLVKSVLPSAGRKLS